jgi:hypothetical protein
MCWLAGDDPLKIQALEKMPIIEYFILLDKKINEMKKASANGNRNRPDRVRNKR